MPKSNNIPTTLRSAGQEKQYSPLTQISFHLTAKDLQRLYVNGQAQEVARELGISDEGTEQEVCQRIFEFTKERK